MEHILLGGFNLHHTLWNGASELRSYSADIVSQLP